MTVPLRARPLRDAPSAAPALVAALVVCVAFGLVYSLALTFVYVEGDDADTVAYHVLGRDSDLQPPYSPYQSLTDTALGALPAREAVLRTMAMAIVAMCAPVAFFLMLLLAFDWGRGLIHVPMALAAAFMLLAIPEFYYLGMVLTPSLMAIVLVAAAHLLLRRVSRWPRYRWPGTLISSLLFGMGTAIRWDVGLYGLTIVADVLLTGDGEEPRQVRTRIRTAVLWGSIASVWWLATLWLTGYDIVTVLRILRVSGPEESVSVLAGVTRIHTLFTPVFAVLICAGAYEAIRHKHPLRLITPLALLALGKLMLYGTPKWIITAFPPLMALAALGLSLVWARPRWRLALIGLALLPWIVGVRMTQGGVGWGPGFELQPFARVPSVSSSPAVSVGPGSAVPTPEGPRPLFGHAWVLGGAWRTFVNDYWQEQKDALRVAIIRDIPVLLQGYEQGWGVVAYSSLGFTTTDPYTRLIDAGIVERRWIGPDGATSTMLAVRDQNALLSPGFTDRLRAFSGKSVVAIAYSSNLVRLHAVAPESLQSLGRVTAVLDLDQLSSHLRSAQPDRARLGIGEVRLRPPASHLPRMGP